MVRASGDARRGSTSKPMQRALKVRHTVAAKNSVVDITSDLGGLAASPLSQYCLHYLTLYFLHSTIQFYILLYVSLFHTHLISSISLSSLSLALNAQMKDFTFFAARVTSLEAAIAPADHRGLPFPSPISTSTSPPKADRRLRL